MSYNLNSYLSLDVPESESQVESTVFISHNEEWITDIFLNESYKWEIMVCKLSSSYYVISNLTSSHEGEDAMIENLFETMEEVLEYTARVSSVFNPFSIKMLTFDKEYSEEYMKNVVSLWRQRDETI